MSCINPPEIEVLYTDIPITVERCCETRTSNVLMASDGVLYDSTPEPIFITE